MKKLITITMVLMLAGFMFAQPRMGKSQTKNDKCRPMMGQNAGNRLEQLGLTEVQMSQLQELRNEHQKDMITLRADLKVNRIELKELIADGKTRKSIDAKQNSIAKVQSKMADLRIDHQIKVRKVVGEEIYKKMSTMNNRSNKHNGRSHRRSR